ncbi:MAG: chromosomal replication initiator protein DnaA [Firmicutes bacterium]|nr:chromosomal replication initiator protein DnaA [Bacillota bacterium]
MSETTDNNEIWLNIKSLLKEESHKTTYDTFLSHLEFHTLTEDVLYLKIDPPYFKDIINLKHLPVIKECAEKILNRDLTVSVLSEDDIKNLNISEIPKNKITKNNTSRNGNIDERYIFDNFVVGSSNQMANAMSVAVAQNPGTLYNPLFLYGNSGLGKTHLMHAIGNYVLDENENAKVLYTSCEKFMNELISAIKSGKNVEFRDKYRKIDVLLIDDIQFISGKQSTQVEFFHTFNDLTQSKKQIIICSDVHPNEMPTLEDRLRTRFNGGMVVDIAPPDFETRTAILEKKAETDHIKLPKDVAQFIAQLIKSNIRELEGSLNKVIAYSRLIGKEISIDLVKEALKDIINGPVNFEINVDSIQEVVAKHYNVPLADMKGNKKNQPVARARQVSMYLCCQLLNDSLSNISKQLDRTHATVIHGKDKIAKDMEKDDYFKKEVLEIEAAIKNMK